MLFNQPTKPNRRRPNQTADDRPTNPQTTNCSQSLKMAVDNHRDTLAEVTQELPMNVAPRDVRRPAPVRAVLLVQAEETRLADLVNRTPPAHSDHDLAMPPGPPRLLRHPARLFPRSYLLLRNPHVRRDLFPATDTNDEIKTDSDDEKIDVPVNNRPATHHYASDSDN